MLILELKTQKGDSAANSDFSNSKSSKPIKYTELLPNVERNFRKAARIDFLQQKYANSLNLYLQCQPPHPNHALFQTPYAHFIYYNHQLHFCFHKSFPLFDDIASTFQSLFHLPLTKDLTLETNLLRALSDLMQAVSKVPKIDRLRYQFEETHGSPFPQNRFFLLEGQFFCWVTQEQFQYWDKLYLEAKNTSNEKFYSDMLPIVRALKSKKALPSFVVSPSENPYYMHVDFGDHAERKTIFYDKHTRAFAAAAASCPTSSFFNACFYSAMPRTKALDIAPLFHFTRHSPDLYRQSAPTASLTRFLGALTNRDLQTFVHLSILFANIASPELLTKKLFLITFAEPESKGDSDYDDPLPRQFFWTMQLIFQVSDPGRFCPFMSIGKFLLKKNIPLLHKSFYWGNPFFLIEKGSSRISEAQLKKFRKYLNGSKISYSGNPDGPCVFRNQLPILCFSSDHKTTAFLEQNLPCLKIELGPLSNLENLILESGLKLRDFEWMRTNLPLYGLFLLAEKEFYKAPLPFRKNLPKNNALDSALSHFLETCCHFDAKCFVYADRLYEAYQDFYRELYHNTPLKRSQFAAKLKLIPKIQYKRPHVSRSEPNKYAFIGISLLSDWWERLTASASGLPADDDLIISANKLPADDNLTSAKRISSEDAPAFPGGLTPEEAVFQKKLEEIAKLAPQW